MCILSFSYLSCSNTLTLKEIPVLVIYLVYSYFIVDDKAVQFFHREENAIKHKCICTVYGLEILTFYVVIKNTKPFYVVMSAS